MDIRSETELRERYAQPSARAVGKQLSALDAHCRHFIAHSPFLVMGTAGADGSVDVSPKGDPPGFVAVLDDRTLLVPDRPGNNRLDGMRNVLQNPQVGLLFMIPGVNETLRVNGTARIVEDPERLAALAVQGKAPKTALEVAVREAFLHCPKAYVRSALWDPEARVGAGTIPSMGRMLADQISGVDAQETDAHIAQANRTGLY